MSINTPDPRARQLQTILENRSQFPVAMEVNFENDLRLDSLDIAELTSVIYNTFGVEIQIVNACGNDVLELLNRKLGPAEPTHGLLLKLTEDQFIARYHPETLTDGSYYRQRDWCDADDLRALRAVIKEGRVWTAVDGDDGQFVIVSGMRYVNRLYYIITEKPVENEAWVVEVQDPDEGPCVLEETR